VRHLRLHHNWGYGFFAVAVVVFAVCMVLSLGRIKASHITEASISAANLWGVAQANYELLRLVNTLDAYATGTLEVTRDDLMERFDIFWSRLPLLVEGPDGQRIVDISDAEEIIPDLRHELARLEPGILAIEPGEREPHLRLREALLTFHSPLHRLFVQANQNYVFATSRRNRHIDELYRHHRIYQGGILISVAIFVLLLVREIRSARSAQREAITARNQLGTVIDAVPVMISMVDRNCRYLLMNRHQREVLRIDEPVASTGDMIMDPDGDRLSRRVLETCRPLAPYEQTRLDAEGRERTWLTTKVPVLDHAGAVQQVVSVSMEITERKVAEARIQHMAMHDPLTGLPNRLLFADRLSQLLGEAGGRRRGLAVHCLDFDNFKEINDALGHPIGDALLIAMAQRLQGCVRGSDTIARIGGDEFAVIQCDVEQPRDAARLAENLRTAMQEPFLIEGHEIATTITIGISLAPRDGDLPGDVIKNADLALYQAKTEGRGSQRFFRPEMNERAQRRLKLAGDLRRALERREFELHYQPKVDLARRRISGLEALLRWPHPEHGMIPPAEFIPVAEETGLILPLGTFVLKTACRQLRGWLDEGLTPVPVAVNLSAAQFARQDLVGSIRQLLEQNQLEPCLLELEITESVLARSASQVSSVLDRLRALGVSIALDDFGTGYSSLSYLHRFPIDSLKIDKSFISRICHDQNSRSIVEAILSLARTLHLKTVAEGIETEEQVAWLLERGCDEVQGFYFEPPSPARHCVRWLAADAPSDVEIEVA
jgi:diguanylate cyclase (GGDEF)-like protein